MARPLRIEFEGALYHVMARGNAQTDIFLDDEDRQAFVDNLARGSWGQVLFHAFSFATVARRPCSVNSICELIIHGPATKNRIRRRALPRHGTWKRADRYLSGRRGSSGIRR